MKIGKLNKVWYGIMCLGMSYGNRYLQVLYKHRFKSCRLELITGNSIEDKVKRKIAIERLKDLDYIEIYTSEEIGNSILAKIKQPGIKAWERYRIFRRTLIFLICTGIIVPIVVSVINGIFNN